MRYNLWIWFNDELNEYIHMRIILKCDWVISIWEKYEHARIILSYDDISIMQRIIENSFYKNNKENSIILNLQSMWELIYSSQDISRMIK